MDGDTDLRESGRIIVEIPTNWPDLVAEAKGVSADFGACALPASDKAGIKLLTDAEYDSWVRTTSISCPSPTAIVAPKADAIGDIVDDN